MSASSKPESINLRQLKMQIVRRVQYCLQLAEQFFQRPFPCPQIHYSIRGLKAGGAYLQKNEIGLNQTLLLENSEAFIQQVVPHELAHLLAYQLYGHVKPHGKEWQGIMNEVFHLPADTCHQFDTESVRGQTFPYQCDCQTHQLSLRRHNKIQRQQAKYYCRQCQTLLRP